MSCSTISVSSGSGFQGHGNVTDAVTLLLFCNKEVFKAGSKVTAQRCRVRVRGDVLRETGTATG